MSGSDFDHIIHIVLFLIIIWVSGRLCKFVKLSPLIGWIAAGMAFGPEGLSLIDKDTKPVWTLLGTLGVTLLICESGTHIHFDKLKKVGQSAVIVAVIGTFLPVACGLALAHLFGASDMKTAFAAGCSMAPTSVGVALKLLTEANQLNSLPGQTIVTAAFLDDVFSIILFVVLQSLQSDGKTDSPPLWLSVMQTFLFCFLFLAVGVVLAIYVFSRYIPKLLHYIPSYDDKTYQPRDEMHLMMMMTILIAYSYIGDKIGSHLLGAFIAGVSFSQVGRSMYVWRRQMKRLNQWLIRLFFACSVAFTIPVKIMLDLQTFLYGLIFALVAGVLGKFFSGFGAKPFRFRYVIGFAMVGRGEFAYLVASEAHHLELLTDELYAIIVWALLISVIIAPMAFKYVLQISFKQQMKSGIKWFRIKAEAKHHTGVHFEVVDVLHNLKLDILEAKVETDGDTDASEFIVGVSDDGDLDAEKIHDILHDIREAIGDTQAQVQLLPIDEEEIMNNSRYQRLIEENEMKQQNNEGQLPVVSMSATSTKHRSLSDLNVHADDSGILDEEEVSGEVSNSFDYMLEIKLMSSHSSKLFAELIEEMELNGIQLIRGHMQDFLNTDSQVIFGKILRKQLLRSSEIREIKNQLKNVLALNHLTGEMLVKKVHREDAVLPHHVKFSDLLQNTTDRNNPLLANKIQNGYEIDIASKKYVQHLILSISNIFEAMELDIRTIHVKILDDTDSVYKFLATFFVQHSEAQDASNVDQDSHRHAIENSIAQIFQKENIGSTIKTKAIEFGKKCIAANNQKAVHHITINVRSPSLSKSVPSTKLMAEQPLAAITESVLVITPKASSLPASVEKGETTFNLVSLGASMVATEEHVLDMRNEDFAIVERIDIASEDAADGLKRNDDKTGSASPKSKSKQSSSSSILDILNQRH